MILLKFFLIFLFTIQLKAQENAQTRISKSLLECYEDPNLMQRDNLLPMTLNVFLDLIRKVETDPGGRNMDMRMLAVSLLHRFRLDGIVRASKTKSVTANFVPYSPQGFQFSKHKILLTDLIPGNAFNFPNSSLTPLERCSLHRMLSNTVEEEARGDEGTVCNKLSQYRTQRLPRQAKFNPDIEILDLNKMQMRGNLKMLDDNDGDVDVNIAPGVYSNDGSDVARSQCPVESGVIRTTWGSVSAGTLLAGIAAGLQPIDVTVGDMAKHKLEKNNARSSITIDNRFAATLAGDLAEVALRQGPLKESSQGEINVGAGGGWNNTLMPKWYFLSQSKDYECTDAEIRGGYDGLILGKNMKEFQNKASNLKLSQLIDMYYSQRGVFDQKYRACQRQSVMLEVAPTDLLKSQTLGFSYILDEVMTMENTIVSSGFEKYTSLAVDSLNSYIPRSLNDLSCSSTAYSFANVDSDAATDIYVVLDASWQYSSVSPILSNLLQTINVSPLGSNITIMNAKDGRLVINSTYSLSTFHEKYNFSVHQSLPLGFELPRVLEKLKELMTEKLNREKQISWNGGKSKIVLMVIGSTTINDGDLNYSRDLLNVLYEVIPDLRFIYLTNGPKDKFGDLVKEPAKDIFSLSSSPSENAEINKVTTRIKEIPRRIINSRCGSEWTSENKDRASFIDFVAPSMINYYRLHPNYFFKLDSPAIVSIQGQGYGSTTICYSRSIELPRKSNSSTGNEGIQCESVTSNRMEIKLENACSDQSYIHKCQPLYLSVEGVQLSGAPRCSELACPYPDSIKYTINLQDVGCFSSASIYHLSSIILLLSLSLVFKSTFITM